MTALPVSPRRGFRRLAHWLQTAAGVSGRWAADLVFPRYCLFCGEFVDGTALAVMLCPACRLALAPPPAACCLHCAAPVPGAEDVADCPRCRSRTLHFQSATALGVYRGPLREAVLRMKRPVHEPLTLAMGRQLAQRLTARPMAPIDWVVPVPMHWTRRLVRGVNHSELLAESVARSLRLPLRRRLVRMRRKTRKQGTLGPAERASNVRGAFAVSPGRRLQDATILLVDDVMTTGATASEMARVCRRAGARRVDVAVVARGIGIS